MPIGNLLFGAVVDAIGARWVLLGGAAVALVLSRYSDLSRLPPSAYLHDDGVPHAPIQPACLPPRLCVTNYARSRPLS